jgi:hypothetical protein
MMKSIMYFTGPFVVALFTVLFSLSAYAAIPLTRIDPIRRVSIGETPTSTQSFQGMPTGSVRTP